MFKKTEFKRSPFMEGVMEAESCFHYVMTTANHLGEYPTQEEAIKFAKEDVLDAVRWLCLDDRVLVEREAGIQAFFNHLQTRYLDKPNLDNPLADCILEVRYDVAV